MLEEIKKRTKHGITEYMHDAEKSEQHRQDAEWLLQELEKAQEANKRYKEALLQIIYEYEQSSDDKVTYRMYKEAKDGMKPEA